MHLLKTEEIFKLVSDIIHKETQQHENNLDLTVSEIYSFTGPGPLDFGGSEFQPAKTEMIKPEKDDQEDNYGWWKLPAGIYKAVFNEKIKDADQTIALLTLHEHAKKAGIINNEGFVSDEDNDHLSINFIVPESGCNIKENARMAALYVLT